ncbi:hypothetical protein BLNAU_13032 [Blattamonas nauphoetae]|uniref:Uncharacterized protein n=1 Tax=Blattamonas nauphoetae TaxID=2049346 RepID=A0ABQ9XLH7_9EUKA|nr:hypothetical protein BLNAU_13032 [Blattamonas nauphoetae]
MLLTPPSTPQTQQKQSLASPSPQTVFSPQFRMVENADTIFQEIKERLFSGDDELLVKKDEAASIYPYLVRLLGNKPNSEIQEESDEDDDKPDPRTPTKKAQNERFFSRRKNDIDRKVGRILDREMKIKEPRSRKKKTALQPSPITKVKRDEPTDGLESQDWENSVQKVMRLGIREEEKETMLDLQMNMSQFDNEEEWDDDETQEMGPAKEIYPDWRQVVTTTPLFSANYWNQQPSQSALTDPTNVFIIPPAFSLEERQHVLDHTEEKISSTLHSSLSIDFPPPSQIPNTPLNVSSYLQHCTTQPQSLLLFLHQNLPIYGPEWPRGDTSRHDSYFYPPIIQNSDKMNFAFIREYSMSISTLSMVQLQLDVQSSQSSAPSASSPVTTIPTSTLLDLIGWGSTLTRRFTQRNISAQFFPPAPDGTKRPQMIGVQKPEFFAMNERRNDFVMTTQTFFSSALSEKKEKQRQESLFTPVSTSLSSTNVQQSAQRKEAISDEGSSVLREMNTLRTLSTDIIPYLSFLVRERATLSDSNQTTTDLKEDQIEADAKSDASLAQTPRPVLNVPSKFASVREKMNIQREQQNKRSSSPQQELSQGVNISTLIPRPLLPFFSSNTLSCSISSGQRMLTGPPQRLLSLDTATDRFFIEEKVHTAFDESDKFVIDTLEESDKEKPEKQEERKQDDVDDGADDWMNPES